MQDGAGRAEQELVGPQVCPGGSAMHKGTSINSANARGQRILYVQFESKMIVSLNSLIQLLLEMYLCIAEDLVLHHAPYLSGERRLFGDA